MSHYFSSTCGRNMSLYSWILLSKQWVLVLTTRPTFLQINCSSVLRLQSSHMASYLTHRYRRLNVIYSFSCEIIFVVQRTREKGVFLSANVIHGGNNLLKRPRCSAVVSQESDNWQNVLTGGGVTRHMTTTCFRASSPLCLLAWLQIYCFLQSTVVSLLVGSHKL